METRIPRHVSIIMDGNGRWAKARGKERVQGHIEGVESVRACVEAAAEDGVEFLSLYAFSEENWNRPAEEVSALMDLMMLSIRREVGSFVKNGIRCIVLGNRSRLSEKARSAIEGMERETAGGRRMTLVVFLSYSGKWDILQAAQKAAAAHPDLHGAAHKAFKIPGTLQFPLGPGGTDLKNIAVGNGIGLVQKRVERFGQRLAVVDAHAAVPVHIDTKDPLSGLPDVFHIPELQPELCSRGLGHLRDDLRDPAHFAPPISSF